MSNWFEGLGDFLKLDSVWSQPDLNSEAIPNSDSGGEGTKGRSVNFGADQHFQQPPQPESEAASSIGEEQPDIHQEQHFGSSEASGPLANASEEQLERVKALREENERLTQLKSVYQKRVNFATSKHEDRSSHEKVVPTLLRRGHRFICAGVIDDAVEVELGLKKAGKSPDLDISNCFTTGRYWSRKATVRAMGHMKNLVIRDCDSVLVLVDSIQGKIKLTKCSQVTVVIASSLPTLQARDCSECCLVGKFDTQRDVVFETAKCSACWIEYFSENEAIQDTADVMNKRSKTKKTYLPDVVVAQCKANALNCELTSAGSYPDECMPLCAPIIEEFMDIRDMLARDRKAEQLERSLQVAQHQALPLRKQNLAKAKTFRASDSGIKQDALFLAKEKLIDSVDI